MSRKVLWILVLVVMVLTSLTIVGLHQYCMRHCIANFQGPYPEIACKYECGVFNKLRRPTKRP